jgi:hypothetical protein
MAASYLQARSLAQVPIKQQIANVRAAVKECAEQLEVSQNQALELVATKALRSLPAGHSSALAKLEATLAERKVQLEAARARQAHLEVSA